MKLAVKNDGEVEIASGSDQPPAPDDNSATLLTDPDYMTPSDPQIVEEAEENAPISKRPRLFNEEDGCVEELVHSKTEADAEVQEQTEAMEEDQNQQESDGVGCMVPGCGRRHGRICTFPAEGTVRASWNSVIHAVFPDLPLSDDDSTGADSPLKLICEEHFTAEDFDAAGLILPTALPSRFPGGVKVVYQPADEASVADSLPVADTTAAADTAVTVSCCVPGCNNTDAADKQMFEFPEDSHKVWVSVIGSVATSGSGNTNWIPGDLCPDTNRPLQARVCQDHFSGENFSADKGLEAGAVPTLFNNGRKRVLLKPVTKTTANGGNKNRSKPVVASTTNRVRGPIFVNVTTSGLNLITKAGNDVPLTELTYAELRRIFETLRDRARVEESESERKRLRNCMTQMEPEMLKKENVDDESPAASAYIINDIASLHPDLENTDILRTVGLIKATDKRRRQLDRRLSRLFADSDYYARRAEDCLTQIHELKRQIVNYENTYVRVFKNLDQKQMMSGSEVTWSEQTLTTAANLLERIGFNAYSSLLQMGMPLPPAEDIQLVSAAVAAEQLTAGVHEHFSHTEYITDKQVVVTTDGTEVSGHNTLLLDEASVAELDAAETLQSVSADDIQSALLGRGELRDSRGRTVRLSLATSNGQQSFVINSAESH